eukprot:1141382-Pelagomonas_calceolata.AAC.2
MLAACPALSGTGSKLHALLRELRDFSTKTCRAPVYMQLAANTRKCWMLLQEQSLATPSTSSGGTSTPLSAFDSIRIRNRLILEPQRARAEDGLLGPQLKPQPLS